MDISIALGGGGSRGHAHVGVIRRLQQEGFHIRAVAGTSAGGIVAAMFAAGYSPDEMESIFARQDQSKFFGRSPNDGPSLLGLSGAAKVLEELLGQRTFEELLIPCALVAVDITTPREVVLAQGRVMDAVLATIALPGIFPPKELKGHQLVDGAVFDPVPVSVVRSLAPSLPVLAVVLTPLVEAAGYMAHLPLPVQVPAPIVERITHLRVAQAFTIFLQAVDVSARMLTELRLQVDSPEVIIRPEVEKIGLLDVVDVHQTIRLGEQAVDAAMPELKRLTAWPNRLRRKYFPRRS